MSAGNGKQREKKDERVLANNTTKNTKETSKEKPSSK